MSPGSARLQKLVHFLTAFTITLKAISKLEHPEGSWLVILLFFAAAIYIVTITLRHERLHAHERELTASVYVVESIVTGVAAGLWAAEGKQALPSVMALASLMFLVAAVIHLTRQGTTKAGIAVAEPGTCEGNGSPAEGVEGA